MNECTWIVLASVSSESAVEWMNESTRILLANEWMKGWKNEWRDERMNEGMKEWIEDRRNGWMKEWTFIPAKVRL